MDIYILNTALKREYVLDEFESFVWTERFIGWGDFQIVTYPTRAWKSRLRTSKHISISESETIMEIERTYITEDEDGTQKLTVTGRGNEKFLEQYIVYPNWLGYEKTEDMENTYYASGQADNVLVKIVTDQMLIENHGSPNAIIPELEVVNQVGSTETIEIQERPDQSVYDLLKGICETYKISLEVEHRKNHAKPILLRFRQGVDRPKVIYSSTLDNLAQESYLNDVTDVKNICYVATKDKGEAGRTVTVYSYGASYDTVGLKRREMWVNEDLEAVKYSYERITNLLTHRGRKALSKHRKKFIFDGVITNYDAYRFKKHYNLGDTVYIMDELGNKAAKTVTEYTWAWDGEGLRSYPTFVSDE